MEMGHCFTTVGAVVDDQTETVLREALVFGDLGSGQKEMTEHRLIFCAGFGDADNGFPWDDQVVKGCLRRDVFEANAKVVFVENLCGDLLVADLLEQCFIVHVVGQSLPRTR